MIFLLNYVTYICYINLVEDIIGHQKFLLTYRQWPMVATAYRVKLRELLMTVILAINRY